MKLLSDQFIIPQITMINIFTHERFSFASRSYRRAVDLQLVCAIMS